MNGKSMGGLLVSGILSMSACAHSSTEARNSSSTSSLKSETGMKATSSQSSAEQAASGAVASAARLPYPATRADAIRETMFGQPVADPYRWLEDASTPEVKAWMAAQDDLARKELAALAGRESVEKRLKELAYVDSISAPVARKGRYFYMRRHANKEKGVYYWRQGDKGEEKVLLDPNQLSADGSVALGFVSPSYDGKKVVYSLKPNNADEAWLYVMDVDSGKVSDVDVIDGAKYAGPDWTPDGKGFYYTWLPTDPTIPISERPGHAQVRFHTLGEDPKKDLLVHAATGDPKTFIGPDLSHDGRWLFVAIQHGWNSNDLYLRDTTVAGTEFKPFIVGEKSSWSVTAWKNDFYIVTNDGAPRGRVLKAPAGVSDRKQWKELIPERDSVLENVQIVGNQLVLTYLHNASNEMEIRDLNGGLLRKVELPGIGSTYGMTGNPDEDEAYFTFMSFTRPPETWKTSIKTGSTSLWNSLKLPIKPDDFEVEQVWYPSKDGTRVSMFIFRKKGAPKDGKMPFILNGYGGFNNSMTPSFASNRFVWLEAGGGFAIPNLRGGGEYGEDWHKAGMLDKKQNVFDDFIAAAEFLIKNGYTSADKLAISGGSNGGLLVGATMTQRPELFKAVICAVPLLDMIRYQLFGSGRTWIPEYGTAENEADFKWIYAYSPYHHVVPGTAYPSMLMLSAENDDRVDPMHARKFVAAMQAAQSSSAPVLLRIEANAGHGGGDMVKKNIEQGVDTYVFLAEQLGLTFH